MALGLRIFANICLKKSTTLVVLAKGSYLFPSRTQKSSPLALMILSKGKVSHRQDSGIFLPLNLTKI